MASTDKTQNFNLSQFVDTDKPSWLTDYNDDMEKIEAAAMARSVYDPQGKEQDVFGYAMEAATYDPRGKQIDVYKAASHDMTGYVKPEVGGEITEGDSVLNAIGKLEAAVETGVLGAYPVGSIYMSVVSTSPAEIFGGVWEEFAAGRVLVGVDASQDEFAAVDQTGGEKEHILVETEVPKMTLRYPGNGIFTTTASVGPHFAAGSTTPGHGFSLTNLSNATVGNSLGNASPMNNLQPYVTCYMWKRTA